MGNKMHGNTWIKMKEAKKGYQRIRVNKAKRGHYRTTEAMYDGIEATSIHDGKTNDQGVKKE